MDQSGHKKYSFPKRERLSKKKEIEGLFANSSSFYLHPLILKYCEAPSETDWHKCLVTVSKKNFKKAPTRNLIKRRLREAYRLNKHLVDDIDKFYHLGFVYVGKTVLTYEEVELKLKSLLLRLKKSN